MHYNIDRVHLADAIERLTALTRDAVGGPDGEEPLLGGPVAAHTLNILTPSVNNLTARIFVRAAGLDFEEEDIWGKTARAGVPGKYPAHLTPMLEGKGSRGATWGRARDLPYLSNTHGSTSLPHRSGRRAIVNNAKFYLIGTSIRCVARATYPTLGFPQYAVRWPPRRPTTR